MAEIMKLFEDHIREQLDTEKRKLDGVCLEQRAAIVEMRHNFDVQRNPQAPISELQKSSDGVQSAAMSSGSNGIGGENLMNKFDDLRADLIHSLGVAQAENVCKVEALYKDVSDSISTHFEKLEENDRSRTQQWTEAQGLANRLTVTHDLDDKLHLEVESFKEQQKSQIESSKTSLTQLQLEFKTFRSEFQHEIERFRSEFESECSRMNQYAVDIVMLKTRCEAFGTEFNEVWKQFNKHDNELITRTATLQQQMQKECAAFHLRIEKLEQKLLAISPVSTVGIAHDIDSDYMLGELRGRIERLEAVEARIQILELHLQKDKNSIDTTMADSHCALPVEKSTQFVEQLKKPLFAQTRVIHQAKPEEDNSVQSNDVQKSLSVQPSIGGHGKANQKGASAGTPVKAPTQDATLSPPTADSPKAAHGIAQIGLTYKATCYPPAHRGTHYQDSEEGTGASGTLTDTGASRGTADEEHATNDVAAFRNNYRAHSNDAHHLNVNAPNNLHGNFLPFAKLPGKFSTEASRPYEQTRTLQTLQGTKTQCQSRESSSQMNSINMQQEFLTLRPATVPSGVHRVGEVSSVPWQRPATVLGVNTGTPLGTPSMYIQERTQKYLA